MIGADSTALAKLVADHRILVCAGSGGVGKTTMAASLALWGALQGRRAIVLTIDPARRLADSLGVGPIGNVPSAVPADLLGETGGGTLSAMMLDQQGSWDELVSRHAPSPEVREQILANSFYRHLSASFAGSQEYMAVEQLGALEAGGAYDLIVVDTPPTQHALDFLDAPDKLLAFLDKQIVKWFLPGFTGSWSVFQSMNRSMRFVLDKIEDATGVGVLSQISEFFSGMGELFDGFEARVERVTRLLRASDTAFVLVAGPDEQVLGQAEYLQARMAEKGMPLKGVVMNRVYRLPGGNAVSEHATASLSIALASIADAADLPEGIDRSELVDNLRAIREGWRARARGDALRIELFCDSLPDTVPVVAVPNLSQDVHELDGLRSLHEYLFAEAAGEPDGRAG
jgi:anion-transporting  ArsA/GET3 family ATPase